LLFELENSQSAAQLAEGIDRLSDMLKRPHYRELRRAFLVWVKHVLVRHKELKLSGETLNDLSEVQDMLATRLQQWQEEYLQQGIEKGEHNLLQQLMEKRFGPLPDWATEKLAQANSQQLETWGLKLLDAGSLDEVFE